MLSTSGIRQLELRALLSNCQCGVLCDGVHPLSPMWVLKSERGRSAAAKIADVLEAGSQRVWETLGLAPVLQQFETGVRKQG